MIFEQCTVKFMYTSAEGWGMPSLDPPLKLCDNYVRKKSYIARYCLL